MSAGHQLSVEDVKKLLSDPSTDNRALTASKVASAFANGALGERERILAEEIFRIMARDVELKVREALSQSIRLSPELPHDVAVALANDIAEVALPIIEASSVLTDDDLLGIIQSKPAEYQVAVAGRAVVSERISDALVETCNEDVVARLVANDGAQLNEKTMSRVLDDFGHIKRISNPMAERSVLPMKIAERLVTLVSEKIRDHLVTHHDLSPDVAMDLLLDSRERATLNLLGGSSDTPDVFELVDQLHANGRLTPTIIMRALCMGDISFFEVAMAKRADIPVANAHQLIHDRGGKGLARLFHRCGLPAQSLPVAKTALQAIDELSHMVDCDRQTIREMTIERVLTQFEESMDPENLDYFIAKIAGREGSAAASKS
ncbi:DUF2336 domain-containing protein [Pedomonas mirosovicensis]|uniref:DUF2336 domain-containing protein n=1 Tax=Pedomonas mirosovicensis TaxID=2908641 RepID=UPI0021688565|nr:DUF2336 domain-containing protein [Pedomonas mirosovicensis]MCH8685487.1 DUF2336 domain-containing protein [Pedomonas mirosovicensis]